MSHVLRVLCLYPTVGYPLKMQGWHHSHPRNRWIGQYHQVRFRGQPETSTTCRRIHTAAQRLAEITISAKFSNLRFADEREKQYGHAFKEKTKVGQESRCANISFSKYVLGTLPCHRQGATAYMSFASSTLQFAEKAGRQKGSIRRSGWLNLRSTLG